MFQTNVLKKSIFYSLAQLVGAGVSLLISVMLANFFGASKISDAFVIVFGFMMVIQSLVKGAFLANFTPHYIELKEKHGTSRAMEFVFAFACVVFALMVLVAIGLYLMQNNVMQIIALRYKNDAQFMATAKDLYSLFLPFVVISSTNTVFASFLFSEKKLVLGSVNGIIQNVCAMTGLILGYATFGIKSLALGYIGGVLCNNIGFIIYSAVHSARHRHNFFSLSWRSVKEVLAYLKKIVIWIITFFILKSSPIIEKIFLSFTFVGAIFLVDIAQKVIDKLISLMATGIIMTVYPDLAKERFKGENEALRKNCKMSFQLITTISCFIIVPFLLVRLEVISFLFGYGKMTQDDITKIALAMLLLVPGILFQNLLDLIHKIFIAFNWVRLQSIYAFGQFICYMLLCFLLIKPYSYLAVPLAFTIVKSSFFVLYYFTFMVRKRELSFISFRYLWRLLSVAALSALVGCIVYYSVQSMFASSKIAMLLLCLLIVTITAWTFIIFARLFKLNEVRTLEDFFFKAISKLFSR